MSKLAAYGLRTGLWLGHSLAMSGFLDKVEKETGPMLDRSLSVLFLVCFGFRGTPLLGVAFRAFLGLFEAV